MENTGEADYFSQRRGSVSRYDDPPPEDAARQAAASSSSSTETTATTNNTAITGTSTSASTLDAAAGQPRSADTTMMVASQPPMADFDSSFLAIAAAARAQAEASASTNSAYSSGDVHPPPVPYSGASAPFPLRSRHQRTAMLHAPSEDPKAARNDIEAADEADAEELSKTRCYWAVLSTAPASSPMSSPDSSPTFLYLDPVFAKHMGAQAEAMLGTSFFDYIHPEEKARAEVDMRNIIDSRTLFGSVSRCRYSRVPRIRRMLGAKEPPTPKEVKALQGQQADFIPIDIVVNWIGADVALCFFHAIIDKSPQDNDEERKTEWSNWCGMPQGSFTAKDSQDLWSNVRSVRKLEPSVTGPAYVFQILSADSMPDVLFSWPPPRLYPQGARERQDGHDTQVSYADGSYFPDDFAKLAQGVDSLKRELSDANTSCTRRYRAKHTLTTDAMLRGVESVLIPYGSIVLACFGTSYAQLVGGLDSMGAVAPRQPQAAPLQTASQGRPLDASSQAAFSAYPRKKSKTSFSPDAATRAGAASSDDGSGTSVATLAAVAAAAAAQTKRCESCGTSNSPEWRKGPDGSKSMCNACGLRYSRSIARARKREERARIAAEVAANGGVIPPHLRKQPGQQQKQKQQKQPRQKEKHKHLVEADEKEAAIDSAPHEARQHDSGDFLSSTAGASFDPNASQGPGGPLDMARAAAQVAAAAAGLQ